MESGTSQVQNKLFHQESVWTKAFNVWARGKLKKWSYEEEIEHEREK